MPLFLLPFDWEIGQLFADTLKWARFTGYSPNSVEVDVIRDSQRRVAKYLWGGMATGGLSAWAALNLIGRVTPLGWMPKAFLTCSTCLAGASVGASVSGRVCLKQLVSLQDSPMAEQARSRILQNKDTFPSANYFIEHFPKGSNEWTGWSTGAVHHKAETFAAPNEQGLGSEGHHSLSMPPSPQAHTSLGGKDHAEKSELVSLADAAHTRRQQALLQHQQQQHRSGPSREGDDFKNGYKGVCLKQASKTGLENT